MKTDLLAEDCEKDFDGDLEDHEDYIKVEEHHAAAINKDYEKNNIYQNYDYVDLIGSI